MRLHLNFSITLPLFVPVARELQRAYDVEQFSGFVYGRNYISDLRRLGFPTKRVAVFSEFLQEFGADREPDLGYLREKEEQYGIPNLYLMIVADRFLSKLEHRRALRILEGGFRLLEGLFDEARPDAVLSDGVACAGSYIQYAIAKQRGIPHLTVGISRYDGRSYAHRNHLDRYERVEEKFAEFKRTGMPPELRPGAVEYVEMFRATAPKPSTMLPQMVTPKLNGKGARDLVELLRSRRHDPHNYLIAPAHHAVLSRFQRIVRQHTADRLYFGEPRAGERFLFFPLHLQPELTTGVLGPLYMDQIALAENLARSLPIDHVLYVKEHLVQIGRKPLDYYRRLRAIPNLRLITPYWDSHDLIRRSSAVAVISSTVGWEAMLYQKPVIMFGEACYRPFDQIYRVENLSALPELVRQAVNEHVPDEELLLTFVAAMIAGTYEGNASYIPGLGEQNPALEPDNVRKVARGLAEELGWAPVEERVAREMVGR